MCLLAWGQERESELEVGVDGGGNFINCFSLVFVARSYFNEFLLLRSSMISA